MASYLVDSSVAIRCLSPDDPLHRKVFASVSALSTSGNRLCYTPQVGREIWSVLTRPQNVNGYGLSPTGAAQFMKLLESTFDFCDDSTGIYRTWSNLVEQHGISGRQVHDANHVAAVMAHGLDGILTLDERDFRRYPGIAIVRP